jgi:hypothetical protein
MKKKTNTKGLKSDQVLRISNAVTKIYLFLSMCEHGDDFPDHKTCRSAIKTQLRRIHKALGNIPPKENSRPVDKNLAR